MALLRQTRRSHAMRRLACEPGRSGMSPTPANSGCRARTRSLWGALPGCRGPSAPRPGRDRATGGSPGEADAAGGATIPRRLTSSAICECTAQFANGGCDSSIQLSVAAVGAPSVVGGGFHDLPTLHRPDGPHGDADKKIWITELGAATGTFPGAMTPADQARTIVQARRQVQYWDWRARLYYYELRDAGTDRQRYPAELRFSSQRSQLEAGGRVLMD